ncbi:unnamed protein product [Strongylus vulgaris]|uniref:Uncharacterized protein n=1 Tax=Strongylus vulgaris TaxID=40348 RepID=A0A3P7L4J7_STRVU|nr:unnamed protein product [Strongylus vulgaris]
MFLKCLTLAMESVKPMTLEWVISCIWCFMAIHGFASAVCVASWTRTGLLPTVQDIYPITIDTMFGVEPLVYLMVAFSSTLALIVHVLVFVHVNHEWISYNEELTNASKLKQLTVPDVLDSFSARQSELMRMTKFVRLFVTLSTVFASLTAIDGLYFMAGLVQYLPPLN